MTEPATAKNLRDAAWALDKMTDLTRVLLEPIAAMGPMNAETATVTVELTAHGEPMSSTDARKLLDWVKGDEMQDSLRALAGELESAAQRIDFLEGVLRSVEWVQQRWNGAPSCPSCGGYRHLEGHDPDCQLRHSLQQNNDEKP